MFAHIARLVFVSVWLMGNACKVMGQIPPALTLTILPTTYSNRLSSTPSISFSSPAHFYVLLTNNSSESLTFFEEWNSWGYYNLSFEITYPDGRKEASRKAPRPWTRNYPSTYILAPQGSHVFEVDFGTTWNNSVREDSSLKTNSNVLCQMRAVYTVEPTEFSVEKHAWTGTVTSEEKKYKVWR